VRRYLPEGAIGLMQLMPGTAMQYGADPSIPEQNIDARNPLPARPDGQIQKASQFFDTGHRRLQCGSARGRSLPRGVPPFRETRGYIGRVLSYLRRFEKESKGRAG